MVRFYLWICYCAILSRHFLLDWGELNFSVKTISMFKYFDLKVLLLVEGILSLYSGNTWTLLARRYSKIRAHWLLQGTGFILIITGIVIEYIDKDKIGREHWEAFHSIVGLTSAVFMLFAVAFGVSAYYSQKLKDFFKPLHIKIFHNVIATITISTGMSSMIIAYFTKNTIIEHDPGNNVRFWMAGFTSITLLITLLGPLKTLTFQIKTALKS